MLAAPPTSRCLPAMTMKRFTQYFLRGLITVLPVVLTLYLLWLFLSAVEDLALVVLRPIIGGFYVPGMGLVMAVAFIVGVGFLVSKARVRRLLHYVELPFTNIPVVKSVYSSLKSFADYFTPSGNKQAGQQVVLLRWPGDQLEMVGLVTRRGMHGLPAGFLPGERVAVYLPMGYNIGGYTVFVPLEWVHPIAMSVEEAMRSSLIAWMARTTPAPGTPAANDFDIDSDTVPPPPFPTGPR